MNSLERRARAAARVLILTLGVAVARPAIAQTAPAPASPAPRTPSPQDVGDARKHYDAGLQLTKDEAYDAALAEFERAFQIAPNYRILYNIGGIRRQLNDFAGALRAFERYLAEGGSSLPADRVAEVQQTIAVLRTRVGHVQVHVDVDAADVTVDDVPVGRSPIAAPLVINPGRRKVMATKAGSLPATTIVVVTGGETAKADLKLTPLTGATPQEPVATPPAQPSPGEEQDATTTTSASKTPMIVAWAVTGGLAIGAAVSGVAALDAAATLRRERTSDNPSRDALDDDQSRTKTLALVSDVFTAGTVVAAGAAVYLTVRAFSQKPVTLAVRPGGFAVRTQW
jgi:hypothetical protein